MGPSGKYVNSVSINSLVFNPIGVVAGNIFNNFSSISNILISNESLTRHAVDFSGSSHVALMLLNSFVYHVPAGYSAVSMTNDPGSGFKSRLYTHRTYIESLNDSAPTVNIQKGIFYTNTDTDIENLSSSASARAIVISNDAQLWGLDRGTIAGKGDFLIEISGSSSMNLSNILIQNTTLNKSGIKISTGCTLAVVRCVFDVAGSSGYCIDGVLGSAVIYAQSIFFQNNKFKAAIGPGLVQLNQTVSIV